MTYFTTNLQVAKWLMNSTGVRKVMGLIPVRDQDFVFDPRSWRAEYVVFLYLTMIALK